MRNFKLIALITLALVAAGCGRRNGAGATTQPTAAPPSTGPVATLPAGPVTTATAAPVATQPVGATDTQSGGKVATAPAALVVVTPQQTATNPFGVMLNLDSAQSVSLVQAFGVVYFRPAKTIFLDAWNGNCPQCDTAQQAGLKLILSVRNNGGGQGNASTPPTDLAAYQKTLGEVLDKYHPEVVIVENEENSILFYTGTADQYAAQLQAACAVAHSKGVKCANGGMVSAEVAFLIWDNYVQQGNAGGGCSFAKRALDSRQANRLCNAQSSNALSGQEQESLNKGKALLKVYKSAGADYMNFHWYVPDTGALEEAAAFLKTATGLPLMTNEMGQHDEEPATVGPLLQKALDLGFPYIVWYSVDSPQARALNNPDYSMRPNGQAFANFIRSKFK